MGKGKKTTMKVMKAMKAKRVSKIAKGKMARAVVFRGSKEKTSGGMTKASLTKNKNGKIVSRAASQRSKKAYANSGIKKWADAVKQARKALNRQGVVCQGQGFAEVRRNDHLRDCCLSWASNAG